MPLCLPLKIEDLAESLLSSTIVQMDKFSSNFIADLFMKSCQGGKNTAFGRADRAGSWAYGCDEESRYAALLSRRHLLHPHLRSFPFFSSDLLRHDLSAGIDVYLDMNRIHAIAKGQCMNPNIKMIN